MLNIRISNCGVSVVISCSPVVAQLVMDKSQEFFICHQVKERKPDEWLITAEPVLNPAFPTVHRITQSYNHLDEPERIFLIDDKSKILQIVQPIENDWLPQMLVRLSRDALRNIAFSQMYYLHGAFIIYKDFGICILGEKRSGKTTSVMNILSFGNSDFVSNDDVSVAYENGEWVAYGWPRALSVRKDSVQALEKQGAKFNWDVKLTHPYNQNGVSDECYTFYPKDLVAFTGGTVRKSHRLDAVIFTSFGESNSIELLDTCIGEQKLNSCILQNINEYFGELGKYFMQPKVGEIRPISGKNIKYFELRQNFSHLSNIPELLDQHL